MTEGRLGKAIRRQLSLEVFPNEALCDPPVCVNSSHRAIIHVDVESVVSTQHDVAFDETCFASHSEPLTLYQFPVVLELQVMISIRDGK